MVEVISRFQVESGCEAAVREAFRRRPRLVDRASGFLGLEVFNEPADPTVFHLVTRWVDQASYDAWHGSDAHRQANRFLPKGLKLVPGSAHLTRLVRVDDGDETWRAGPAVAELVATGHAVHLLVADEGGTVRSANQAMASALGIPPSDLAGRSLWGLLTESDVEALRARVARADVSREERLLLNFVDARQSPFSLECLCDVQPGRVLIVGESPREDGPAFREEWLQMNNQLAVLTRENARQNRELRQAKQELEQALTDLRDSHWHLQKLQEVLPICMECGMVKAGTQWEDVASYLKKHALFLSHGYCPTCLARVAAAWGLPGGAGS